MKASFQMTLTDISDAMLENSRRINPECEYIVGDMRTMRLNRLFDCVFIHDAITYMLDETDLRAALRTAAAHCKPGGRILIMPDYLRETFRPGVHHGGHDKGNRGLRYLEWTFDSDPTDSVFSIDFVYMLREGNSPVRVVHDRHTAGLFPRAIWFQSMREAGISGCEEIADPWQRVVFLGGITS
jgi:SAM-dependent methyltransferase